jgi:hypothetical protein
MWPKRGVAYRVTVYGRRKKRAILTEKYENHDKNSGDVEEVAILFNTVIYVFLF